MSVDVTPAGLEHHLRRLVESAGHRPPGSPANRAATDLVREVFEGAQLPIQEVPFTAIWWRPGTASVVVQGVRSPIDPPPFSRPGSATGPVVAVVDEAALDAVAPGSVVLLREGMAEALFPKAFPFVVIDSQRARISRLEATVPAAVLAVAEDPVASPVFEDPDLAFMYATITPGVADAIPIGATVTVVVGGALEDGAGAQLAAGGFQGRRAVVSAHLDSKVTTPGALDNGGGLAVLLALAEAGVDALGPTELVPFNGEDHYAAPGEQAWLAKRDLADVSVAINIDGAGLRGYPTAISTLGGGDGFRAAVKAAIEATPGTVPGEPWFESDHAVFAMNGIPAIAITSGAPFDLLKRLSHAPEAGTEHVDSEALAAAAAFVQRFLGGACPAD